MLCTSVHVFGSNAIPNPIRLEYGDTCSAIVTLVHLQVVLCDRLVELLRYESTQVPCVSRSNNEIFKQCAFFVNNSIADFEKYHNNLLCAGLASLGCNYSSLFC